MAWWQACHEGSEGIIGKRLEGLYVQGRSRWWVKVTALGGRNSSSVGSSIRHDKHATGSKPGKQERSRPAIAGICSGRSHHGAQKVSRNTRFREDP
jgi:ATP-dependent DNA ligase